MRKLKTVKSSGRAAVAAKESAHWTFLSNHAHVLLCLAQTPDMVLREVAGRVGITERAVQKIIADLESGGALSREKIGRQNRYVIHAKLPLRHPIEAHCTIASMLSLVEKKRI